MKIQFGNIKKLVSVTIFSDGNSLFYNACEIKFKKGEIEIVKQYHNIKGTELFMKEIGKDKVLLLNVEGKGVLNKKVNTSDSYKQQVIINGNANDFYFTDFKQDDFIYTSVLRKSFLEHTLLELKNNNLMVVGIASGPFLVMAIQEYLGSTQINSNQYQLNIEKGKLVSYQKNETTQSQKYKVGKDFVNERAISSLAHAAVFFQPSASIVLPEISEEIKTNIEEAGQKVLFQQFGFALMGFFLLALLGNYLYLDHLNKVHQANVFQLADFTETFNQINELEEEKTRKETLLRKSGVLTKKFVSFYISKIANTTPREIHFTEFIVKPAKDEIKNNYKIEIDNQQIIIKGTAKSSHYLSDWLVDVKAFDWIRKVEIEEYEYTKGYGEFYLKIII